MEHHSNQTSWLETLGEVILVNPDREGRVDLNHLEQLLNVYKDRQLKIGSFTACSNVTGIQTPYHKLAKLMHQHGGLCFVDFAASAPYVEINMHPEDPLEKLDAIFFSPHKFLGGPGTSGVLVFDSRIYTIKSRIILAEERCFGLILGGNTNISMTSRCGKMAVLREFYSPFGHHFV